MAKTQAEAARSREQAQRAQQELDRLHKYMDALAFEPLSEGVNNRDDALHVMGFAPDARPNWREVRSKYRVLASIHHPDSNFGDHKTHDAVKCGNGNFARGGLNESLCAMTEVADYSP